MNQNTIIQEAVNLIFAKAVRSSDGFRQFIYNRHGEFSRMAMQEIRELTSQGKTAQQIADAIHKRHA